MKTNTDDDDDDDTSILDQVMEFCMSNNFEQRFQAFSYRHAQTFECADETQPDEEHPLSYHQAYQQYLNEFEGYIEGACVLVHSVISSTTPG